MVVSEAKVVATGQKFKLKSHYSYLTILRTIITHHTLEFTAGRYRSRF